MTTLFSTRWLRLARVSAFAALGTLAVSPAFAEMTKINVGALRFTSHAASFVALERGYFKEEGLDVTLKFFQAAQPMAVGVASKDVDYAVTAMSGGLVSLAQKGAIKVVGGALSEEAGIDGSQIIVSKKAFEAGMTDPSKLDGAVWALTQTGSSFHYTGSQVAKAEGIKLKYKPLQKVGAIIGALKSSQVDAWAIVPHIAKALDKGGAVHIIGNIAKYIPDYQVTVVFTSANNAAKERKKTEAFLRAFSRGADDFNAALVDNTAGDQAAEDMVKLIHKYVYTSRPYEKAAPSIRNGAMRINKNAAMHVGNIKAQLNWFKSEGLVDKSITFDTVVDTSYVSTK